MTFGLEPETVPSPGLDAEAIELANAYGPYTHGTWSGRTATVGNEEALAGRGRFMASLIRRAILGRYTPDQLRTMTLVDVGCYDGWLICQLEDLPFARLIGVEPRQKNLDKGVMIRKLLGIETRCEFRRGAIETLEETLRDVSPDVVTCTGLLHHLPSTADGIARLHAVCRDFLFLETICLPASVEDDRLRDALELKDLPYFFGSPQFGVTGHKFESGYYDGSALRLSVVSLPSVEALRMFLQVQGFAEITVVADPESYSQAVQGGWRLFQAVCMTATRTRSAPSRPAWVDEYEGGLVRTLLPADVARTLYQHYTLNDPPRLVPRMTRLIIGSVSKRGWRLAWARRRLARGVSDRYAAEIVKNLRFSPHDKAALEHGKCLAAARAYDDANAVLFRITRRLNADWRSVYRAFCILTWVCRDRGDPAGARRYEDLCLIANPQFPQELLGGSVAMLRPMAGPVS